MTFIQQIRVHRLRFVKTLAICLSFMGIGLCNGIVGPTLLDLQLAAGTTLDKIALVLPGRSGGYAIGSFTIGLTFAFFNPILMLTFCLGGSSIFMAFLPFQRSLEGIIGVLFANGLTNGLYDSCANMFLLHIWGKENSPFMQG